MDVINVKQTQFKVQDIIAIHVEILIYVKHVSKEQDIVTIYKNCK